MNYFIKTFVVSTIVVTFCLEAAHQVGYNPLFDESTLQYDIESPAQVRQKLQDIKNKIVSSLYNSLPAAQKLVEAWDYVSMSTFNYIRENSSNLLGQKDTVIISALNELYKQNGFLLQHLKVIKKAHIQNLQISSFEKSLIDQTISRLRSVEQIATNIVADTQLRSLLAGKTTLSSKKRAIEALREWGTFVALLSAGIVKELQKLKVV